ncbi:hypothetical protein V502_01955 [Pseudogymnoascus sp. VKM F-4520 (FW-2644)]|nr:hypothetical protein V502_01955 [Pseudogymnoascus sp. VKM F-4520 (FW-2644)]
MDGFGKHLSPPLEDSVVCHFYETTAASLSDEDHTRYLHLLLPDLYNRSAPYSPLRLAVQAISYATLAKSRLNLAQRSREFYGRAISALNSAIRDPDQVKSDQTLYAVLLLSGHQTITWELGAPQAYGTHIDGAAALLRVRGKEQTHIPNLQSQANIMLSHSTWPENGQPALELLKTAKSLDSGILDWAQSVPATWSYTIATDLNALSYTEGRVSDFSPPQIHRYPNFYIARVWNIYRVSRLIVLSIILRVAARSPSHSTHGEQELDLFGAERRQGKLVDEICASVPFLLNREWH